MAERPAEAGPDEHGHMRRHLQLLQLPLAEAVIQGDA